MSYRAEITYDRAAGKFIAKVPTFADYDAAVSYSEHLADVSSMIADYRVMKVDATPSHTFIGNKLRCIAVEE